MDYTRQPVTALLRGPLVSTPQGLVVITCAVAYLGLAVAYLAFGLSPPLGKTRGAAVVVCVSWPLIIFLVFVKQGIPSFAPSLAKSLFLTLYASAPILYVLWLRYA